MNRMLDIDPIVLDREPGPVTTKTLRWLTEIGLADCDDPNAMILAEASLDLDELNSGVHHLSHKDLVMARGKVRHTITTSRRNLQALIDENATMRHHERHKMHYSGIAARTLGWIDAELLSPELRSKVADHLAAEHGIDLADYAGKPGTP